MATIDGGLRPLFRRNLPDMDWQSIEVGSIGSGVPDSNYCCDGVEGWVEFKKTTGWVVELRKEQAAWIDRRCRHGGRVCIAVRQRGGSRDNLWLLSGRLALLWRAVGLPRHWPLCPSIERDGVLTVQNGGPARWDWTAIRTALVGETTRAHRG